MLKLCIDNTCMCIWVCISVHSGTYLPVKVVSCKWWCVLSIWLPPPSLWLLCCPSSKPFPLLHSLCTRRAQHSPRGISHVSTLPYKWRHWLWGLFDTHSHTVQTQLIFSGALAGGGCWRKIYTRITDHRPSRRIRTTLCEKEQNVPLIRMWQGAVFPQSQQPSTKHYQQTGKGKETHKYVILSCLCSHTLGIMRLAVSLILI